MQYLSTKFKVSVGFNIIFGACLSTCVWADPVDIPTHIESVQSEQSIESAGESLAPAVKIKAKKSDLKAPNKHIKTEIGANPYHALIAHHAAMNNVPFFLANSMIRIESRYNPTARNGANLGLGQISLSTAKSLGYSGAAQGLMDANTNLTYSIKYLAQAYRLASGDTCGTVARYQNGLRSTRRSAANRAYCAKVSKV